MGLSSAEGNILVHLLIQDKWLRQEDLVAQLDISKPAVSRALESLESKGYVAREKDPEDRRVSRALLTAKARELGPGVMEVYKRVYAVAARGITEDQVGEFIKLFSRVSESITTAWGKGEAEGGKGL